MCRGVLSGRKKHSYPSQNALRNTLACFLAGEGTPLPPIQGFFLRIIILNFYEKIKGSTLIGRAVSGGGAVPTDDYVEIVIEEEGRGTTTGEGIYQTGPDNVHGH